MDLSPATLDSILDRAVELKEMRRSGTDWGLLAGKTLAMVFDKNSTRTRVSFEAGMAQLGGSALFLSPQSTQQSRGRTRRGCGAGAVFNGRRNHGTHLRA